MPSKLKRKKTPTDILSFAWPDAIKRRRVKYYYDSTLFSLSRNPFDDFLSFSSFCCETGADRLSDEDQLQDDVAHKVEWRRQR